MTTIAKMTCTACRDVKDIDHFFKNQLHKYRMCKPCLFAEIGRAEYLKLSKRTFGEFNTYKKHDGNMCLYITSPHNEIVTMALIDTATQPDISCFSWEVLPNGIIANKYIGYLARFVMKLDKDDPNALEYINTDRSDCRKENLRLMSPEENLDIVGKISSPNETTLECNFSGLSPAKKALSKIASGMVKDPVAFAQKMLDQMTTPV